MISSCPKCNGPRERRGGAFALRALGSFPGLYCESCKTVADDPENSFEKAERGQRLARCKAENCGCMNGL